MRRLWPLLALCAAGCKRPPEEPVCGLHAAASTVYLDTGKKDEPRRALAVGARLLPSDRLEATGPAMLECYGGAFRPLEKGDEVRVGDLKEARLQGVTLPVHQLTDGKAKELEAPQRTVVARYSGNRFTPESALKTGKLTSADYLKAFFAPNGMESLQAEGPGEGPRNLLAPPNRPRVPTIHAGDQGDGPLLIEVDDEAVFLETDDLATSVLLEGRTYSVGRGVRLLLPDDAEATLELRDGKKLELEGPMELRLQPGQRW